MRLKKIKLAGFKSFADLTHIDLTANLIGIVGPNGCGKSNVIDAIKWVLGELSPKQLRGNSMSDVIFNGTSQRKPIGKATVELVFDNSVCPMGGEYSKYSELAIRREIDRTSGAEYFFNNASCRRKDITDIFLGTGLGPQGYSIIEQGMIAQIIEAKPEELRTYIEEAAGISKYKERRRETATHIKHTRENLSRLNDIRTELDTQLQHLNQQVNTANYYKKLKQDERLAQAQCHAITWRDLTNNLSQVKQTIEKTATALEDEITTQHTLDAKINAAHLAHQTHMDSLNHVQQNYYQNSAAITKFEQQIKNHTERHTQITNDLARNVQIDTNITTQLTQYIQTQNLGQSEITNLQTEIETAKITTTQSHNDLILTEQQAQNLQQLWDEFNTVNAQINQTIEVEQTHIHHLEQTITNTTFSINNNNQRLSELNPTTQDQELQQLNSKFATVQTQYETLNHDLTTTQTQINTKRTEIKTLSADLNTSRGKLHNFQAQHTSLETLQKNLSSIGTHANAWLTEHKLDKQTRLIKNLEVVAGWELAVETVLAPYIEAILVENLNIYTHSINGFAAGNVTLLEIDLQSAQKTPITYPQNTLASKIQSPSYVTNLVANIYAIETLAIAMELRPTLQPHESIITQDGIWLGKSWLRITKNHENKTTGIIQRMQELKNLTKLIETTRQSCSKLEATLNTHQLHLTQAEQQHQTIHHQLRETTTIYSKLQSEISAKQMHITQLHKQITDLKITIGTQEQERLTSQQQLITARNNWEVAVQHKADHDTQQQNLTSQRTELSSQLIKKRETAEHYRQNMSHLETKQQLLTAKLTHLQQDISQLHEQQANLTQQQQELTTTLTTLTQSIKAEEQKLETELKHKLELEQTLAAAKEQVTTTIAQATALEQQRTNLQKTIAPQQLKLEELRIEHEHLKTKSTVYQEQIRALNYELSALVNTINSNTNLATLEQKLTKLKRKIEELGPVNLAALAEHDQINKRKQYLDSQNDDLVSAITTLEAAIDKIDQDTKTLFQETFTSINQNFQLLFPKAFNGGNARLELTSNQILEAGVSIVAQPPGKKNSTIHLLSGGEKALTAISLLFAIFQLHPAPFCMLDEVDAALDDTNTARFCSLLKEMAETVQCIFISHNKLTLEIANQLTGVTMREPGLSRIVSVNVQNVLATQ